MTHMPGIPVKFDKPDEWKKARSVTCQGGCNNPDIVFRTHSSSCGGYEDEEIKCRSCGHTWWVDGIDS